MKPILIEKDNHIEVRPNNPDGWLTTWISGSEEQYSAVKEAWLPPGVENPYREISAQEHETLMDDGKPLDN